MPAPAPEPLRIDRVKRVPAEKPRRSIVPPEIAWVEEYAASRGKEKTEAQTFHDHHTARGWKLKTGLMVDWEAAWRTWEKTIGKFGGGSQFGRGGPTPYRSPNADLGSPKFPSKGIV